MGLDVEETIMDCEETFGVRIAPRQEEWDELQSVGGLYCYIVRQLREKKTFRCPNVPVFFSFRDALVKLRGLPKDKIRPESPLATLLPRFGRRRIWRRLQQAVPYRLPGLKPILPASFIGCLSICLGLPIALVLAVQTISVLESTPLAPALFLLCALFPFLVPAVLFGIFTRQFALVTPAATIGELVRATVSEGKLGLGPNGTPWTTDAVWVELRSIVALRFDVDEARVRPDTHFVKDLGA